MLTRNARLAACLILAAAAATGCKPLNAEALARFNRVHPHDPYEIRPETRALHHSLLVADWHADTLLWSRDMLENSKRGHVDLPRLREGGVAVQVFTSVTQVPSPGPHLQDNDASRDRLATLVRVDRWPSETHDSLFARSTYHARRLHDVEARAPEQIRIVRTAEDLHEVLRSRTTGGTQLAALLGTEGLHPLEGRLENVEALFDAGYRVMGLHHFFDNELGGSLHGLSDQGLTPFGREVVAELDRLGIIIDVAHSSEASVRDVLALSSRPVIVSHTGMHGACESHRNIPDALMQEIATQGGLIGVGFWEAAICGRTPEAVVRQLRHAIDLVGVEHVSLGSDFDGTITTPFDASELAILTQTMVDEGFAQSEIRAVMGENTVRFLGTYLPPAAG